MHADEATSEGDSSFLGAFTSRRFGTSQGRRRLASFATGHEEAKNGSACGFKRVMIVCFFLLLSTRWLTESLGRATELSHCNLAQLCVWEMKLTSLLPQEHFFDKMAYK